MANRQRVSALVASAFSLVGSFLGASSGINLNEVRVRDDGGRAVRVTTENLDSRLRRLAHEHDRAYSEDPDNFGVGKKGNGERREFLAYVSGGDFEGALNAKVIAYMEGTDDCWGCVSQAHAVERLGIQYDELVDFDELQVLKLDLGNLSNYPQSAIIPEELMEGIPRGAILIQDEEGKFELAPGSISRDVVELRNNLRRMFPDMPHPPRIDLYLDLKDGRMVDWLSLEKRIERRSPDGLGSEWIDAPADVIPIFESIRNHRSVTRIEYSDSSGEYGIVREFNLNTDEGLGDAFGSLDSLAKTNYDSEGRISLMKLQSEYLSNTGRVMDEGGFTINVDEAGFGNLLDFLMSQDVRSLAESYAASESWGASYDLDRIARERVLREGGLDEEGVEYEDIFTTRFIIGNVVKPTTQKVRDFRVEYEERFLETMQRFIPENVRNLTDRYGNSLFEQNSLPVVSPEDLDNFIGGSSVGEHVEAFDSFAGKLRDYNHRINELDERMRNAGIIYGTVEVGGAMREADSGVFTVVSPNSLENLERVIEFYEGIRGEYGDSVALGIIPWRAGFCRVSPSFGLQNMAGLGGTIGLNSPRGYMGIFDHGELVSTPRFTEMNEDNTNDNIFKYLDRSSD